jgi:hypothetical protein
MVDVHRVRELREKIREVIGFKDGVALTDEMLSATMAVMVEVWTMRIHCSPEKHTTLDATELMEKIAHDVSILFRKHAEQFLPHSKIFSEFSRGDQP